RNSRRNHGERLLRSLARGQRFCREIWQRRIPTTGELAADLGTERGGLGMGREPLLPFSHQLSSLRLERRHLRVRTWRHMKRILRPAENLLGLRDFVLAEWRAMGV